MAELTRSEWERTHQHFEEGWWGDCANTYGEETKQLAYARVMGLDPGPWQAGNPWPVYDLEGRSVIDVGGGPVSMLLKCTNIGGAVVVDPCAYPRWTQERYAAHGIGVNQAPAEDVLADVAAKAGRLYDEAWCYNVLQHVHDPAAIIAGMRAVARRIRIFEWVEVPAYLGHPHTLHVADLEAWCAGTGELVVLDEQYQPVAPEQIGEARLDQWRVEQLAWGGVFES